MAKDIKRHMRSHQTFNKHKQNKIFKKGMIFWKNGKKKLNRKSN